MLCKTCDRQYHYCSSCGTDGYSEYGYCSPECMDFHQEIDLEEAAKLFSSDQKDKDAFMAGASWMKDYIKFN